MRKRIVALIVAFATVIAIALPSIAHDASANRYIEQDRVWCWGWGDTVHIYFKIVRGEVDAFKIYLGGSYEYGGNFPANYFNGTLFGIPDGQGDTGDVYNIDTNFKSIFDFYIHNGEVKPSYFKFFDYDYPAGPQGPGVHIQKITCE